MEAISCPATIFRVLGVGAAVGRVFTRADDLRKRAPVDRHQPWILAEPVRADPGLIGKQTGRQTAVP